MALYTCTRGERERPKAKELNVNYKGGGGRGDNFRKLSSPNRKGEIVDIFRLE